jgi:hypothetical protein
MNASNVNQLSRKDIERYIIQKLNEIYQGYTRRISPHTIFKELNRYIDSYLIDPGLLIDIEEDLGIDLSNLSEAEALKIDKQDVTALVDAILRCATLTVEKK